MSVQHKFIIEKLTSYFDYTDGFSYLSLDGRFHLNEGIVDIPGELNFQRWSSFESDVPVLRGGASPSLRIPVRNQYAVDRILMYAFKQQDLSVYFYTSENLPDIEIEDFRYSGIENWKVKLERTLD